MKKIIKRIFVVILSVIFVCSFSTYAYASEKVQPTISFCATLKIVSCPNASNSSKASSGILGHSFLIVEYRRFNFQNRTYDSACWREYHNRYLFK